MLAGLRCRRALGPGGAHVRLSLWTSMCTRPEFLAPLCPLVYPVVVLCPASLRDAGDMRCLDRLERVSRRIDSPGQLSRRFRSCTRKGRRDDTRRPRVRVGPSSRAGCAGITARRLRFLGAGVGIVSPGPLVLTVPRRPRPPGVFQSPHGPVLLRRRIVVTALITLAIAALPLTAYFPVGMIPFAIDPWLFASQAPLPWEADPPVAKDNAHDAWPTRARDPSNLTDA